MAHCETSSKTALAGSRRPFSNTNGVLACVGQRWLELPREIEALIRGDEVAGAQLEVVVEPVTQLEQDRLEVGDELRVCDLGESLLVHACLPTPPAPSPDRPHPNVARFPLSRGPSFRPPPPGARSPFRLP